MKTYFDVIKLIFFLLTIVVALFQLRIRWVISSSLVETIGPYVMPAYFIFVWVIIGYIIGYILTLQHDNKQDEKDYTTGFIIGTVLGLGLAFIYYSFLNG